MPDAIDETDLADDPFAQFASWFAAAERDRDEREASQDRREIDGVGPCSVVPIGEELEEPRGAGLARVVGLDDEVAPDDAEQQGSRGRGGGEHQLRVKVGS